MDDVAAGRGDVLELFAGIHSAEEAHGVGHVYWRVPRSDSANDWLGRGQRKTRQRRVAAVSNSISLAVSAFPRHFVDVPRRLRARRNSNASGGGSRWDAHISSDHHYRWNAGWRQRIAIGVGACGRVVLFWRVGAEYGTSSGLFVGGGGKNQRSRKMADARHRHSYTDTAGLDGVRQNRTVISGITRSTHKCSLLTPR